MSIHHQQQPFDLDRMCAEARERLRAEIDHSARKAHYEWAKACRERAYRDAISTEIQKHLGKLLRSLFMDMQFTGHTQAGGYVEYKTLERS